MTRRSDRTRLRRRRRAAPPIETALSPADRARHRAFETARRAALALGKGVAKDRDSEWPKYFPDPERVERYRWLLAAMGAARPTPGGLAIAELARRGYVMAAGISTDTWYPRALDWIGVVWFGVGLPGRGQRWKWMEQTALRIDIPALPEIHFVSAHVTVRIKAELRREGHDFG